MRDFAAESKRSLMGDGQGTDRACEKPAMIHSAQHNAAHCNESQVGRDYSPLVSIRLWRAIREGPLRPLPDGASRRFPAKRRDLLDIRVFLYFHPASKFYDGKFLCSVRADETPCDSDGSQLAAM